MPFFSRPLLSCQLLGVLLFLIAFGPHTALAQATVTVANPVAEPPGPPSITTTHLIGGVDISAASSEDAAARFLAEGMVYAPLGGTLDSKVWIWGDARVASIQQPGPVSGISNVSTYVSALTSSAPSQIVQSGEGKLGMAYTLWTGRNPKDTKNPNANPFLISFIGGGGVITPLSANQAATSIYAASPQIQSYYESFANSSNALLAADAAAISKACPTPTTTCYVAFIPQGRSELFRDYGAGLRVSEFFFNSKANNYTFPAIFDATVGQDSYVTGGYQRGLVMHLGGSTPIVEYPAITLYASVDLQMTARNQSTQQFLLTGAPSTILASASNVAQIVVQQPFRDRYRFGVAFDITKIVAALNKAAH